VNADSILTLLHLLAAFWYVMGPAAASEDASHYQGILPMPGAIATGACGLFL